MQRKFTLLAFVTALFFSSKVYACYCDESLHAPEPLPAAYDKAAVIFEGEVLKMEALFCKKMA